MKCCSPYSQVMMVSRVLGSNWIPAHSILTELRAEDYRAWLTLLRDGDQNMVRLWGGGVYEPDCFYDICDGTSPV